MNRYYVILAFCLIILTGCGPSQEVLATQTGVTATTVAAAWTDTPTSVPTAAFTPSPTPMLTKTPTLTFTPTPSRTPTITPTPIHPLDRLILHEADETIDYNWFTYVPSNLSKESPSYILVTGLHANISQDYDATTRESRKLAEDRIRWARTHEYILLVPVIPNITAHRYSLAFDLPSFSNSTDPFYQRPDLRVNLMIDRLIRDLEADGYHVSEKVFVEGFSAGGMFAQRYALLHPERVQAIAAGQCGGALTLPESSYDGIQMNWPVGVNDFSSLVGYEFNREVYEQVHQFIYIGDQDTEATTLAVPRAPTLWRSQAQIVFLRNTFGETDPTRLENQVEYLNSLGYNNITFKLYAGVGHTHMAAIDDFLTFFDARRE